RSFFRPRFAFANSRNARIGWSQLAMSRPGPRGGVRGTTSRISRAGVYLWTTEGSAALVKTISLLGSGAFESWAEEVDRLALGSSSGDARAAVLLLGDPGTEMERSAEAATRHYERIGAPATVLRLTARHHAFVPE